MNAVQDLAVKTCKPCEGGTPPMADEEVTALLRKLDQWERAGNEIARTFHFKNYHWTMAFVNAIAWVSHKENHHPNLEVGFNTCRVRYTTHAIGGLSENDFICAAKVDLLWATPE